MSSINDEFVPTLKRQDAIIITQHSLSKMDEEELGRLLDDLIKQQEERDKKEEEEKNQQKYK